MEYIFNYEEVKDKKTDRDKSNWSYGFFRENSHTLRHWSKSRLPQRIHRQKSLLDHPKIVTPTFLPQCPSWQSFNKS